MEVRRTVRLKDEHGRPVTFDYLADIEYNKNNYAVMLPLTGEEYVYIFRINPGSRPSQRDRYLPVDSRAELEAVYGIFKERYRDEFTFE